MARAPVKKNARAAAKKQETESSESEVEDVVSSQSTEVAEGSTSQADSQDVDAAKNLIEEV